MNLDCGHAVPFLGIYVSNFRYSIFAVLTHFRSLQSPDAKISLSAIFSHLLISPLSGADTAILSIYALQYCIQYLSFLSPIPGIILPDI
jgi:hypothetical protein